MSQYAFLLLPAVNKVYAGSSVQLSIAELGVLNEQVLGGRIADIGETRMGGVRYIRFVCDALNEREVRFLSSLSSIYALFEIAGALLQPIDLQPLACFDDDLTTIQKYSGKTNEHFTKLLLNVTLASTDFAGALLERKMDVLDPLCGRGTTLNQAMMYGWSASGVDVDERSIEAYESFISSYLKRKHITHNLQSSAIRDKKRQVGRRFEVEVGATKKDFKAGETIRLTALSADTTRTPEFFRAASFDAVVTDLPYGVQHGSRLPESDLSRRPLDMLAAALPGWVRVVKPGGAIGFAWNRIVAGRTKVVDLLASAGLEVRESEPYRSFRHVVDSSITRDILVARRS